MRILEVLVRYPPYVGGVEHAAHELARRWVRWGDTVHVLCAAEPPAPALVDGVEVTRLPYRGKIGNANLCWGLGRALAVQQADLVHTHLPTAGFAERAAAHGHRRGRPVVLSYHNDLVGRGAKGRLAAAYNRWLLPRLLASCDRIVVPRHAGAGLSPRLAAVRSRVVSIPLGVDLDRFAARPLVARERLRLGFLSLLDEHHRYKGLHARLAARAAARRAGAAVERGVGGEGSERPAYERRAAELGLGAAVDFRGFVPAAELPGFFAGLDLFALPSTDARQEGFGLVALEAMACGRPIVTTPVPGMAPDVEEAATGWIVPAGDTAALAAAIVRLAGAREALAKAGARARALVERRFSWDVAARAYAALFAELRADSGYPRRS